jgi:hypothetical protein
LISKYETKSPPNVTDKLTVSVNPSVGVGNIKNEVKMSVSIYELKARNKKYGMVTMCVGTGQGAAGIFELL